ncbi:MAG: RT0821/Lpp0805 family surface protein [Desulfurivibrionaceae bacterium]|jgi:surface antigen
MALRRKKTETEKYIRRAIVITANMALLLSPFGALADNYHESRHGGERFADRRYDEGHRYGGGPWHYEPHNGWRFEHRRGVWSPFYMWWLIDGVTMLRLAPTVTVVEYPNGHYELRGDGISAPYYWAWVPVVTAPPPPPPGPTPSYPIPPPPAAPHYSGGKEVTGTIIGGVLGGAIGAATAGRGPGRTAGVIVGTLLGSLFGHEIGKSLDEADELRTVHVLEKNKTGQASTWTNPDKESEITVMPSRTYQSPSGEYCREYQTDVIVGGEKQKAFGTACRQADGQWKIVQ